MWKNLLSYAELPKYVLGFTLFLSTALQFWNNYKQQKFESTIQLQLQGVLKGNAEKIARLDKELKTAKSEMISYKEMEKRTKQIISEVGTQTQALEDHLKETDAKILSYSSRFTEIEKTLHGGKIKVRVEGREKPKEIKKPTQDWRGVDADDFLTCVHYYDPDKCPPISYTWAMEYQNKGKSIAQFTTRNLWLEEAGQLDLNLVFKVDVLTFGEDPDSLGSGAVQNQGVYIKGGYFSEDGKFVTLVEDKLIEGDPNLDPRFFYVPTVPYGHSKKYKRYEPSYYVGTSLLPTLGYDMGIQAGGSFVNLFEAKLRIGGVGYISKDYFGVGPSISYHPKIGGKYLNFAPNISYLVSSEKQALSLGLLFQVW